MINTITPEHAARFEQFMESLRLEEVEDQAEWLETYFGRRMTIDSGPLRRLEGEFRDQAKAFLEDPELPIFWGDLDPDLMEGPVSASYVQPDKLEYQTEARKWFSDHGFGEMPTAAVCVCEKYWWSSTKLLLTLLHEKGHHLCRKSGCECMAGHEDRHKRLAEIHADSYMLSQAVKMGDIWFVFSAIEMVVAHLRTSKNLPKEHRDFHDMYLAAAAVTVLTPEFKRAWKFIADEGYDPEYSMSHSSAVTPTAKKMFWNLMGRTDFDKQGRLLA